MTTSLQAKTVVVTGSSKGIGRSMALRLAECGANVLVHAGADEQAANATAAAVRERGVASDVIVADLRIPLVVDALVDGAWAWREGVDIWINNAGADVLTGPLAEKSFEERLECLWEVDVMGTIRCSRRVGQRMKQVGSGVILNVGWDQAWQGMEGDSGEMFSAIKGSIMAFTMSLAKSLAPEVRVNCLAPGWIRTSWAEAHASDYWQQRATQESLRGRWGTPEDVAEAACFLASASADFINAQILPVNGGFRTSQQRDAWPPS